MSMYKDIIGENKRVSDLVIGEIYLVGISSFKTLYLCKRESNNLYVWEFNLTFSNQMAMRIENGTLVNGFNSESNKFIKERLNFNNIGIIDLLYNKIPKFHRIENGVSYIREWVSVSSVGH